MARSGVVMTNKDKGIIIIFHAVAERTPTLLGRYAYGDPVEVRPTSRRIPNGGFPHFFTIHIPDATIEMGMDIACGLESYIERIEDDGSITYDSTLVRRKRFNLDIENLPIKVKGYVNSAGEGTIKWRQFMRCLTQRTE